MVKIVSSGKALHSSEYHEKKRKEKHFRSGLYFLLLIIFVAIPVLLLRWDKFRVNNIEVVGTSVVSVNEVKNLTQSVLDEKYLWVVPKDNDLLIPRQAIKDKLLQDLPRLKSVDINLEDTKTLGIQVEERKPLALYCVETGDFREANNCFFLDEEGFIFAPAPAFSGEVYFIYSCGENTESPVGHSFLNKGDFVDLVDFIKSLNVLDIYAKSFELVPGTTDNKAQYRLYLPDSTPIFWYADEDLSLIRSNIETLIAKEVLGDIETPLDNIEYLDLTLPNKPYWKTK